MQYTHLIVAIIIGLIFPLYAILNGNKTRLLIEKDQEKLGLVFQSTGIILLSLCGLVIVSMVINSSSLQLIGLSFIFNVLYVLALIVVALIGYWAFSKYTITDERTKKLKVDYKDVMFLLPGNQNQYKASLTVSIIAGVCEEIMFRGFLFWQLQQYMPFYAAFVLTNILFALGHAGTKMKNALLTFVLGIVFSTSYVLTDSLWLAIVLHILVDFQAMIIGYKFKLKIKTL